MKMNEYLEKYPWTKGYDPYPEDSEPEICALSWLPKGWIMAFGEVMCDEIDLALRKTDFYDKAYISEAKEKYASMRISLYPSNEEIDQILMKYEMISEHICENCGAVDCAVLNLGGWISVYCEPCFNNINAAGRYKPYNEIIDTEAKIPDVLKWTRYSTNGAEHFEMDISETVEKIRKRYEERKASGEFQDDNFDEWEDNYYGA